MTNPELSRLATLWKRLQDRFREAMDQRRRMEDVQEALGRSRDMYRQVADRNARLLAENEALRRSVSEAQDELRRIREVRDRVFGRGRAADVKET